MWLPHRSSHWPIRSATSDAGTGILTAALLAGLSLAVARMPGGIAVIWLANGALIGLAVSAPVRRLPLILACAALGILGANLLYGDGLRIGLAFTVANTLEIGLGVLLVRATHSAENMTVDLASFLKVLAAGALVAPLLGAAVGGGLLQALGFGAFERVWVDWYAGAALGSAATLPLCMSLRASNNEPLRRMATPSNLLFFGLVAATTLLSLTVSPYPFVMISVALTMGAFVWSRTAVLAGAPVFVVTMGLALALGWFEPVRRSSEAVQLMISFSALLVVVPAQVAAIIVARQRALSNMLAAVDSRVDVITVFTDMKGIYRWVNKAREAYWGTPARAVLGRSWTENVPRAVYDRVLRSLFETARAGRVARRIVELDFPMRGRRTVDILMQPAFDNEGLQIGVLHTATDVTDLEDSRHALQSTADELIDANRHLEQFVRIASHDLREPLNTVIQFCGLLEQSEANRLDAEGQLYLSHVVAGTRRMKGMLDDVLQYVRLEARVEQLAETVDLDRLAADVVEGLRALIDARQAQVQLEPLGKVEGHATLLAVSLQNLLTNAIKFVPAGRVPKVRVAGLRRDGLLRLTVSDNGIGVDAAHLGELGTPFKRLHSRRKFDGTGLGLAICRRVAEQHGGGLEIRSSLGEGSAFTLLFKDSAAPLPAAPLPGGTPGAKGDTVPALSTSP